MTTIKEALKGKTKKQVLQMIASGEIQQYYASQDQISEAVAEALGCSRWTVLVLIAKSNLHRAKKFKAFNLPELVAKVC